MPATENLKFEVELKMAGSADFIKQLKTQLENVNTSVKAVENSLNKGLGVSLDELINKAKQLSKILGGIDSSKSVSGSGAGNGVKVDLTPLITVLTRIETKLNSTELSVKGSLQQSVQNSASVLEQVKLIRTKLYEIGSKFGVSAVSAGAISPNAIPVSPDGKDGKGSINVTCKCDCGNGPNPPNPNKKKPQPPNGLEEVSGYLTAFSAAVSAIGVYSAYAYDKTVDLKESLYAVTLSASQTQAALETVSQQQIVSGYTTEQLKDATILLERMGASAKRYLPIAVNVAQKTGNKLAVVAEDLAGALDSLEALEAFQSKYGILSSDLKRNGAQFEDGRIAYTTSKERDAAGEALSKTLEQSFSSYNNVNTYSEAVNNLQNSIEALAAEVGEQLLPAFISLVGTGEEVVNWVSNFDSSIIGSVSSVVAFTGALAGITPVLSKLIPMLNNTFPSLAAISLGPWGPLVAGSLAVLATAGAVGIGYESGQIQQELKEQEAIKQESSEMARLIQLAREFTAQRELALKHGLEDSEIQNKLSEELSNNVNKLKEAQAIIESIEARRSIYLGYYSDYDDLNDAFERTQSTLKAKQNEYIDLDYKRLFGNLNEYEMAAVVDKMVKLKKEIEVLKKDYKELSDRRKIVKFIDNHLNQVKTPVENAQKKQDDFAVFEKKVNQMQKAVSVAEKNGGDRTGHYIRAIISEESLAPLRNAIVNNYEAQLRKHGETRSDAYRNLTNRNFLAEMLFSLSQKGETDSPLFKELQTLLDLLKKRDSTYPKPEKKEKDLETVLRELKESRGWQSSEETKQKRSSFEAKDRIDPEKWKDLGKQLEQASRDNRAYLQTHKKDLEKFSQAMDAWADKQMDIWETWAQAQLKGHDAAWAKTPEQRLDVSKQTLHYYSELLKSHKDLLSQNEKLNDRLMNAIKEQAEAYSQALQERFEKESAGKTEDEILKAARRNLQSARSSKVLPEDMRVQEINKWKNQIQEALDSIKEKREQQQEQLRSMEAEKQNKQLEELEKRREKGEDVWPQMLALMRQMAAAEIEQVKLAKQKEIDALPEDLRDTQRELAEWHIAQTRDKWQQQILEAYKRGNTKDTKDLDKRKKDIDQAAAAKNTKEDEAVKRERERLTKPATFGSYAEIKQYKDNQRLEALQKKADERKAKNTEQAALDKQKLEQEALQKELDSEKALTESLGSLDASVKALTSAMSAQSAYSKGGEGSSILKDGKKETTGADGGAATSAEDAKPEAAVSEKLKAALPYASAVYSRAGEIYLATGREPVINPRMVEPLLRAQDLSEKMTRQVSGAVSNNNTTTTNTVQNFYIDGAKMGQDPDLRQLASAVAKINERRERRERAFRGTW